MGHQLNPKDGALLPASEVARRLKLCFPYVVVDADEGMRKTLAYADWLEKAPARIFLGKHDDALAYARRLRALEPGEAVVIRFGDRQEDAVEIAVTPGQPILFGYASNEDARMLSGLVGKCAMALDCEVVEF